MLNAPYGSKCFQYDPKGIKSQFQFEFKSKVA